MAHLSSLKIVHGDLAARNCLLDDKLTIKIADFGFTRRMYDCEEYSVQYRPSWPVRWMSPEQLVGVGKQRVKYTFASDVWAFGVVMWEIFTLGSHPYDELNDDEILARLQAGFRLAAPVNCSNSVLELMHDCWNISPDQRPKFDKVHERLFNFESSINKFSTTNTPIFQSSSSSFFPSSSSTSTVSSLNNSYSSSEKLSLNTNFENDFSEKSSTNKQTFLNFVEQKQKNTQ